jgi:hypothetical protein
MGTFCARADKPYHAAEIAKRIAIVTGEPLHLGGINRDVVIDTFLADLTSICVSRLAA